MDSLPSRCLMTLALILLTGILRCFETSIDSANEAKLTKLAQDGDERAKRISRLIENSNVYYRALKVLTVISEIAAVTIGVYTLPKFLFASFGVASGAFLSSLLLAILLLVFGIYVPRRIVDLHADKIVLSTSSLLTLLYFVALPVSTALTAVSNVFLLLFGIKPNDAEEEVTEEEIRLMVDIGSESGAIDPDEKEMIHNIFELDDTQIKDIMTHRTDAAILWMDEKESWGDAISETNHTVYPVCEESIDNIVGILRSNDFYKACLSGSDAASLLRAPYFVPETIKADDLFRQMQKTKTHFAVVLDEYGGLGGIITMSDLLEEIVGTLSSGDDAAPWDDIIKLDANTWQIAGSCDIDLVCTTLGVVLPVDEYNTFAGMILSELGEIPDDGATPELEAYGMQIRVTRIHDHRIEQTKVTLLEKVQDKD